MSDVNTMSLVGLVTSAVPLITPDASRESWCAILVMVAISKFFRSIFMGAVADGEALLILND